MFRSGFWRCMVILLLLGGFGYAQMGYLAHFEAKRKLIQRGIKDRIRKGVPKDELTHFIMPAAEWKALNWVKPEREFKLPNGNMYDVVEVLQGTDTVDAWCIHDKAETVLFAGLKDHISRNMEGPSSKGGSRVLAMKLVHGIDMPPGGIHLGMNFRPAAAQALHVNHPLRSGFLRRWSPPPEPIWS
ncbi:MAG: hypothetical protein JNM31_00825 [Flavobacteriales bacterium]|nr:hypothetical protein [Flavobacteriales bacterium]